MIVHSRGTPQPACPSVPRPESLLQSLRTMKQDKPVGEKLMFPLLAPAFHALKLDEVIEREPATCPEVLGEHPAPYLISRSARH